MRRTNIQTSRNLTTDGLVQILAFVGYIYIVERTEASIRETYLVINEAKTKFMMTDNSGGRQTCAIGGQNLDEFVYLEVLKCADSDTTPEIKHRVSC